MAGEIVSGEIIKLLIFAILLGCSLCMDSNVDITCSSDDSCMETYKLHGGFTKGIPYQGSDILNGTLMFKGRHNRVSGNIGLEKNLTPNL